MIPVVEPIHELQAWVLALCADDALEFLHGSRWGFFAEDMQAALKASDRDLGSHVIAHAHEQCVEVLAQEALIGLMDRDTVA